MSQQQMLESINLSDLGQKSNNDLDLWYTYVVIYSIIYTDFQFIDFNSFYEI